MYLNKKDGTVLIEAIIFLCVLTILITLHYKVIISSLSKFNMYEIKEDIKTMKDDEVQLINKFIKEIKYNEELYEMVEKYKVDKEVSFNYPEETANIYFKIINSKFFLIKNYDSSNKVFRIMDTKIINSSNKEIIIYPTTFKIISRSENEIEFNF